MKGLVCHLSLTMIFLGSVRSSRSGNLYPPVTSVTRCPEHLNFVFLAQILKLFSQLSLSTQCQTVPKILCLVQ